LHHDDREESDCGTYFNHFNGLIHRSSRIHLLRRQYAGPSVLPATAEVFEIVYAVFKIRPTTFVLCP
jgi:hypothetical protein